MMRKLRLNGVAGGDGIDNGRKSIFNRFLGTVLLFVVMTGGVFGQVVFTENMGTPSGTTSIASNTFENSGTYTYSGNGDIRTSSPSAGYTGSSASGNGFLNGASKTFVIDNIVATGYSDLILSFGLRKSTTASNGSTFTVEYSTSGTSGPFTSIAWPALPTGSGTANWHLRSSTSTIPNTITTLRFSTTSGNSVEYRLDDISLTGTVSASTSYSGVTAGATTEPSTLSSLTTALSGAVAPQQNAVINFDFTVTDDANTAGGDDALPTLISQIVIPQGAGNDIANWTQAIAGAQLSDGTNVLAGTVNATNITFASIPTANLGNVADDGTKTYSLRIWLNTSLGGTLPATIDGSNLAFKIDRSNFTTASSATSTQFESGAGTAVESGSTNNEITVVATRLDFTTNPSPTTINTNTNFSTPAVVRARDTNGNTDLGWNNAVTVANSQGFSMSNAPTAFASGVLNFPANFQFTTGGASATTLTVNDGNVSTTDASFSSITVNVPATTVQFASSTYSVSENGGSVNLNVTITNPSVTNNTTVNVVKTTVTSTHISTTTYPVTFLAGSSTSQNVSISIADNTSCGDTTAYTFQLQSISGGNSAVAGSTSSTVLTVNDNDLVAATPLDEHFTSGLGTFSQFSEEGALTWTQSASTYAVINGYNTGSNQTDWLINTTPINMNSLSNESLTINYQDRYNGGTAGIMNAYYSTNFDGSNTATATWTLIGQLPQLTTTGTFTTGSSVSFDLSAITGTNVYIGLKYTSTSSSAKEYRIDRIQLTANQCVTPEPEIDVKGNSVSIINNDTTPSVTDHTDFGSTAVIGGTVVRTFTIENTGTATLNLSSITSSNNTEFALSGITLPNTIAASASPLTFNVTFDPSALGNRTSTITINNNDADENPYTFTIQGTGVNSNSSDIIDDGTFSYSSNINYNSFQSATIPTIADGVAAFRFTIRDGGATAPDADALGTELTAISFNVVNSANIRTARLYDGTTLISSTPTIGATIAFTGLSGTNVTAIDNGTKTLTLYVSFNTAVTDNDQLQYTIASATANATGSAFATANAGGATSSITGDRNRIEVTADRLAFVQQPSNTSINDPMTPAVTVSANDVNGNRDLDFTGSVEIISDGTLTGGSTTTVNAVSGVATFSNLVHSATGTGLQLLAGHTSWTTPVSNVFAITTIVFLTNDYRTTGTGNWVSNNASPAIWERLDSGGNWNTSNSPSYSTTNNVYIRNGHTVTATGSFGSTVKLKIMDGGTFDMTSSGTAASIYVYDGGELRINAALTVVGAFDVENNADVYLNNAFGNPGTTIWAGTENFRPQSNFYVWNWNSNQYFYNNNITANSNGTIFGNLHFDTSGGAGITGNWNLLGPSTGTITLTSGDLVFDSGNNNIRFFSETGSTANVTIKGNLKLNSGWAAARTLALSTSGTMNLTVDGNVEIDSPGDLAIKQANSAASAATLTIKGDLLMNGTNTTSNTNLHLNANNASTTGGGKAILDLKGNLTIGSSATIVNSVPTADVEFNFSGTTLQSINVASTVNGSDTDNTRGIPFYVKANASVQLNTNDLTLANGSRFIVETGGTLDFGFTGSTPRVIKHGATGNSAFTSQAGSILKITSDAGINSTGSTGNVQVTAANRTFTALGDFHYIGKIGQATGNGLPTNVRNLVVHNEGASNNLTLSNASVHVNGELSMIQGNIVSTTSNLLTIGASTSTPGTLNYTSGVVKGTGGTIGTMRRYFAGTNTADATGLFPLGTTANEKRFIRTEFTGTNGGYLDATFVVADMGDNGLLALSSIPAVGSCAGFTVLNTDEDLFWRVTPEAGTLTNGTHRVTLTKDDTSDICKQTVLKRETTSSDWLNPGTHLAGIVNSGNHIVSRQAMNGPLKDFGIGDGSCSGIPVVYNGGAWPATTRLTPIVINADVTLPAGITEACECLVSDNVTLTVPSNATLQIVNGITIEAGTNPNGSEDGNLIIENNGSLIQITDVDNATANNNTGKINMERISKPMYRYDFTYWSSPLFANDDPDDDEDAVEDGTEFNLKQLSPMTFFDKYYKWGHAGAGWITIPVGVESMVPGRGYIVRAPQNYATDATNPASYQPYTANFIGKPNNGTIRHAVSGGADQWNLLGNPYPSAISADSFFDANVGSANGSTNTLEGTIYLWTHNTKITPTGTPHIYSYSAGDYAAYNGTGSTNTKEAESDPTPDDEEDNLPTGFIAAGQSFFIKGTAAGQAVFNNSMRIAGNNNQFFRPASTEPLNNWDMTGKHRVWLNMKGQIKGFSQLLVGYVPNATNDLDIRFDGESFGGNQVTFYSLLADKKLTIQGRALPFNNQDEVPLGYKSTLNGTLTISLDQYDGLFEGQGIYLEDKLLNIVHDLKASNYSFASTIGTFNQRFVLRYVPSSELSNPDHEAIANGLILYQEDGKIMIKSQLEDISQVMVYDLLGRIVFDQNSIAKRDFSIQNVVMNEQPLIVKVKLANGQIVNKKIVH